MPYDAPSAFIAEKNQMVTAPIWLYRVALDTNPANDLFLAEWDENVSFFKDTDTAQTYTKFPMSHGGISTNKAGRIDQLEITVANVSREIQYYLENYNGLRGNKVTVRQVFEDLLADPTAYIEDVYYIDAVTANAQAITFQLSTKLDVFDVRTPKRKIYRNYCPWVYKGLGCWSESGGSYVAPPRFEAEWTVLYDAREIKFTDPGQEGQPERIGPSTGSASGKFNRASLWGLDLTTDKFKIDLYATHKNGFIDLETAASRFKIKDSDGDYLYIQNLHDAISLTSSWTTYEFDLSDFLESGTFDKTRVVEIAWDAYFMRETYGYTDNYGRPFRFGWRNAKVKRFYPHATIRESGETALASADMCNKSIEDCRRHNNVARFGGFPTVPKRRIYRVG